MNNGEQETDRRYYGVVEALVVKRETKGEGRVKLRFPWFDEGTTTEWCRVAQPYAGNGYGALFVPEEETEVAVSFIHGDMRHPIVLGGLYNGEDKPTHRPDNKEYKVIRTKAKHEILLDDTEGEQKIVIRDAKNKNEIKWDTEDNSITIRSQGGKLILEADEIEIRATKSLTADAGKVTVTASGKMALQGQTINLN